MFKFGNFQLGDFAKTALSGLFVLLASSWVSQIKTLARVETILMQSDTRLTEVENKIDLLGMRVSLLETDIKEWRIAMSNLLLHQPYDLNPPLPQSKKALDLQVSSSESSEKATPP